VSELAAAPGYDLVIKAGAELEHGKNKLQSIDIYATENRGNFFRIFYFRGEAQADFTYQDRRTGSFQTESTGTKIYCLLQ
jgi:hypothetical protein